MIPVAEKYGISCEAEECQLVEFFDPDGSVQVISRTNYLLMFILVFSIIATY